MLNISQDLQIFIATLASLAIMSLVVNGWLERRRNLQMRARL